jgi:hypothetical protein
VVDAHGDDVGDEAHHRDVEVRRVDVVPAAARPHRPAAREGPPPPPRAAVRGRGAAKCPVPRGDGEGAWKRSGECGNGNGIWREMYPCSTFPINVVLGVD